MVGRHYNIKLVTGVQELQRRRPESSTLPATDERLQPVARFESWHETCGCLDTKRDLRLAEPGRSRGS
jgi:hypothetical protein